MTVTRSNIDFSEPGRGTTDLETYGISGTISCNLPVHGSLVVSPYAGARYTTTTAGAYTEETSSDVAAPLSVAELNSDATTLLVGVKVSGAFASNAGVFGHLGLEKELDRSASDYIATGVDGLTPVSFDPLNDTRLSAGLGTYIDLSATERLTISGNYRGEPGQSENYAATGMVFYSAGF